MPRLIADADPHVQPLQINVSFPIEEDNGAEVPKPGMGRYIELASGDI